MNGYPANSNSTLERASTSNLRAVTSLTRTRSFAVTLFLQKQVRGNLSYHRLARDKYMLTNHDTAEVMKGEGDQKEM